MNVIFDQVTGMLTNPPGSLAFFLVLLFCASSALQTILMVLRHHPSRQKSRILSGIIIILLAQLTLFILSALTWQVPQTAHQLLPAFDRTLPLFSLLLIAWLWAYPAENRAGDLALIVLGALTFLLGIFTYLFWNSQPQTGSFNSSTFDLIWNIVSILFLLAAAFSTWWQKQDGWGVGLYILLVNLAGFILHFMAAAPDGDLTAAVRLTELISYPFLPLLAQRLLTRAALPEVARPIITRIAEDELETPSSFASVITQQEEKDDFEQIQHLNDRLDEANTLLTEAHRSITILQEENTRLASSLNARQSQPGTSPASSNSVDLVQNISQKISLPLDDISRDAALVKTEGIGLLSVLQRTFVDEIINTASAARSWLQTLEQYPQTLETSPVNTDLNAAIDAVIAGMNTQIRTKGLALRFDIGDMSHPVHISQKALEQILIHLLKNAIEVSPQDATVDLNLEESEDEDGKSGLLIQMSDSGGGIAPKNIDKIFNLPPQSGNEPKYRGIGSLNSLRLAKTITINYNGKIWLESNNKQTTYFVFFPY